LLLLLGGPLLCFWTWRLPRAGIVKNFGKEQTFLCALSQAICYYGLICGGSFGHELQRELPIVFSIHNVPRPVIRMTEKPRIASRVASGFRH